MLRHVAHGTVRDEGVGITTVNATSESAEDASLRRARWFACGEINPSGLRKYRHGRYVAAVIIAPLAPLAPLAPVGGAIGRAFAGHATWAALLGALVGSLLGLQPILQARHPALPDVVFARPARPARRE